MCVGGLIVAVNLAASIPLLHATEELNCKEGHLLQSPAHSTAVVTVF